MAASDPAEARSRGGASPGGRRFAAPSVIVAALVASALLGFLVIRYSATNALLKASPQMAMGLWSAHPRAVLTGALEDLQLTGEADPAAERAALAAFRSSPLSEAPLLIQAREAMNDSRDAQADRLIAEAIRRNPRSRYALLLRLDQDVRLGRVAEAAETMAMLSRTSGNVGPLVTAQLAALAADPRTRPAAKRAMASDPQLLANVLEMLARRGADAAAVLDVAGDVRPVRPGAEPPQWQRLLIDGMVERGQVAQARRLWVELMGADPAAAGHPVYDRDFAGLGGPPPFNWLLETGSNGYAERSNGALEVQFDGRDDARLASQLLLLPPGTYRLSFTAQGEATGEGGLLSWTVACHPGASAIVVSEITGVGFDAKRIEGSFTVPPTRCPGQWLRLVGKAAEFPKEQQVTIRQFRIERGGGR
jgi:hypothetical protein